MRRALRGWATLVLTVLAFSSLAVASNAYIVAPISGNYDPSNPGTPVYDPYTGSYIFPNLPKYVPAGTQGAVPAVEDPVGGLVAQIPIQGFRAIAFGSDGEAAWDPFGAGYDTSDGISFDPNWGGTFTPPWTLINSAAYGPGTFVMPAVIQNCGQENEPICEPIGKWTITIPANFMFPAGALGDYLMFEDQNLTWSDTVTLANINGQGVVYFESDSTPEPTSLLLLGSGAALLIRRRFQ